MDWDGVTDYRNNDSRREDDLTRGGPLGELFYRISVSEKKIDKIDDKVNDLTIGYTTLKIEMTNSAKEEGKLSGIIYGGGGAILVGIILKVIEKTMGG